MMKAKQWVLFSLASLMVVGYGGMGTKHPATASLPVLASHASTSQASATVTQPETIAQMMNATKPTVVSAGSFASGEHSTEGQARIIAQNGNLFLELDQGFKTSSKGPDLVVILHRSSNVLASTEPPSYPLKAGDYLFLAPLQKFSGTQRYAIPNTVNVAEYKSAVIWCRKYNATFGAAKLVNQ